MKLKYLGTAAAEGFPAIFCNCKYCNEAKKLGGKNIRTRSQAIINDNLLIDLPADTYMHFLQNDIEGDKIEYLIITHAHGDHFYPRELLVRGGGYANNTRTDKLKLFCTEKTLNVIYTVVDKLPKTVEATIIKPYAPTMIGEYRITALPARHMPSSDPVIYIIEGDKTLLYAHDTGYFFDEVFEYIENNKIVFDMVSLDCTNVDIPISDTEGHMGFPNIERVLDKLSSIGAITNATIKYVNHFSHNANPLHHILEERAKNYDCNVAYDGCTVIF